MMEPLAGLLLTAICYWPGWMVLRLFTLGRYPPPKGIAHDAEFVAAVGLLAFIVILLVVYS